MPKRKPITNRVEIYVITRRLTHNTFSTYSSLVTKPTVSFLNAVSSIWKRKKFLQRVKVAGKKSYVRSVGVWENLRSAGAKLEETGLSFGGSSLVLELLNLSPLSLPLLLQPPDSHSVLGCAHITISHARHLLLVLSFQLLSSNTQLKPPLLRSIFNHLNQPQNRNRIEWSWIFFSLKKEGHGIIQLRKLNPERSEIWMLKVEIIQKQENRKVIHFEKMTILHAFIRGNRITTDTTFRVWKNRLCKE